MEEAAKKFLRELLDVPGPSGYEQRVQAVWRGYVGAFCNDVRTDVHNNVVATLKGADDFGVMVVGHADEIGMIVVNVDENGYIYFGRRDLDGGRRVDNRTARRVMKFIRRGMAEGSDLGD